MIRYYSFGLKDPWGLGSLNLPMRIGFLNRDITNLFLRCSVALLDRGIIDLYSDVSSHIDLEMRVNHSINE